MSLVDGLSRHLNSGALEELTLTTNGTQLASFASDLAKAGVKRINVSIDSLDPDVFRSVTRGGDLAQVLAGLEAADRAGLAIKINAVALQGINDHAIPALIQWAHGRGYAITLIEAMPMGDIEEDRSDHFVSLKTIRSQLNSFWTLDDLPLRTGGPARYVRIAETGGTLGFITPLTHNFCEACNRVRVTCTGQMYMCLGQDDNADLRAIMRTSDDPNTLTDAIREAISRKPQGHDFALERLSDGPSVERHMSVTGG
jgi:cyclic pyranopterin phosphate synthase